MYIHINVSYACTEFLNMIHLGKNTEELLVISYLQQHGFKSCPLEDRTNSNATSVGVGGAGHHVQLITGIPPILICVLALVSCGSIAGD